MSYSGCGVTGVCDARSCTVCRELVLVCDACAEASHGEFHCEDHRYLKGLYYTFLERFTPDELRAQQVGLQAVYARLGEGGKSVKKSRNRRKTVMKQIEKIQARLTALASGEAVVQTDAPLRCRTCADAACRGDCWGFWAKTEEGKVEVGGRRHDASHVK